MIETPYKCGCGGVFGDTNCPACSWPCHPDGWTHNRRSLERITLDTSCVNAKRANPDLNQLEAWHDAGHIRIQRAPAFLEELKGPLQRIAKGESIEPHPPLFGFGVPGAFTLDGPGVLAGPLFSIDDLRALLLPTTSMEALTIKQRRDLEHLQQHIRTGGRLFVTLDKDDFIQHGRREKLYRIGVWVFTPAEAVAHLKAWHQGVREDLPGLKGGK
jgi:hypothetical protein